MHLLTVVSVAALLFVAYRPVSPEDAKVTTLLLDVTGVGTREIAVQRRWRSVPTPVVMRAAACDGTAAIQELTTRLTVTLPVAA